MVINGQHYETIWIKEEEKPFIQVIDQRPLPFEFVIADLHTIDDVYNAIKNMTVRGAPLIGATAAAGIYLAVLNYTGSDKEFDNYINEKAHFLESSRPTAINLKAAIIEMLEEIKKVDKIEEKIITSKRTLLKIISSERENCFKIGNYGLSIIEQISVKKKGETVNILTHCNAGWLACIDYGTALAPIYLAHDKGIKLHVWVDETRPRNQGSKLTAWELQQHGIPCSIIADNTGGHLMQHGKVDLVIVGCDRATTNGDVANKIGTYLKALAAKDNDVPFYVALPSSSIDWSISDWKNDIPIEERDEKEIKYITGKFEDRLIEVIITDSNSKAVNYGFDVTPARLITGLITEKGICKTEKSCILELFPEKMMSENNN